MVPQRKTLLLAVCALVVAAAAAGYFLTRATRLSGDNRTLQVVEMDDEALRDPGPPVIYWHDSAEHRVAKAVRIDVWGGVAHSRADQEPIPDLVGYVNAELERQGATLIVVTSGRDEKIGDLVRVIDECRKTHARAVVMNETLDAFRTN